jgi:hypothetical protein
LFESYIIPPPDDRYMPGYSSSAIDNQWGWQSYNTFVVGPRLIVLDVNFQIYGIPIPISYGTRRLFGHVMWAVPLVETSVETKKKTSEWVDTGSSAPVGGFRFPNSGGLGPTNVFNTIKTTTYYYSGSWAVVFGYSSGGAASVLRVWANGVLVVDRRAGKNYNGDFKFRFYPGTDTQTIDPMIEDQAPDGAASAYRDLMYMVMEEVPLEGFGNALPQITAELADDAEGAASSNPMVKAPGHGFYSVEFAVDWDLQLAWYYDSSNRFAIVEYDIAGLTYTRRIIADQEMGFHGGPCYIPWLRKFLVERRAMSGLYATMLLVDMDTGSVVAEDSNNPAVGFNDGSVPQYVIADQAIETYVFTITTFSDLVGRRVYAPLENAGNQDWELEKVHTKQYSGTFAMTTLVPGGVYDGYSEMFYITDFVIRKITITPGGIVTDNVFLDLSGDTGVLPKQLYYVRTQDVLLVARAGSSSSPSAQRWYKYDPATGTELALSNLVTLRFGTDRSSIWMSDSDDGTLTVQSSTTTVAILDIATMVIETATAASPYTDLVTDSGSRSFLTQNGTRVYWDTLAAGRTTLAGFIEAVAAEAGYAVPSEFEVDADIDDLIDGGLILQRTNFRAFLDNLAKAYRFHIVESDGKIKIIRKPEGFTSYEFDIPANELALISEGDSDNISFRSRREDELALPRRAELRYLSAALNYQEGIAFAQRSSFPVAITESDSVLSVGIPVIITAVEAKVLAYKMLYNQAWTSRASFAFRLSQKYQYLEPSDVGTITTGAFTYTVAIKEIHYNADLSLSVAAGAFLSEQPIINIDADGGTVIDEEIPPPVPPLMIPIDSKLLLPYFDTIHPNGLNAAMFYVVSPWSNATTWKGAYGEISVDSGLTWTLAADNNVIPVLGMVTKAPDDPISPYLIQEDGFLRVRLITSNTAELVTITEELLLKGNNSALVGTPEKGWEVIQFRDVELIENGVYELSYLVRGRRGTEVFIDIPNPPARKNSWFILLKGDWLDAESLPISLIGAVDPILYRVTAASQPTSLVVNRFNFVGESARPLQPVHVEMEWDGADIDLSFIRQTRGYCEWLDGEEEVTLTEETENFRVTIYTDLTFATPDATIDLDETDETAFRYHATITAAMLTSAYGTATPSTIYVGVKQYSEYLADYGDENLVTLSTGV